MLASATATFLALLAAGIGVEIYSARTESLGALRHGLNQAITLVLNHPARAWTLFHDWRERSYHAPRHTDRPQSMTWAIRAHVFAFIPLVTYLGAKAFEALAVDTRPIAGVYMSPTEAWYFGAVAGFIMAALSPLLVYMAFWALIGLPVTAITIIARRIRRRIIDATDSAAGWDQAPFAITGAALGALAAGVLLVLGG